jgi:hypothetical protein
VYPLPREAIYTEQLPSDSPGIVDVSASRYQATYVPSRDSCIATVPYVTVLNFEYVISLCIAQKHMAYSILSKNIFSDYLVGRSRGYSYIWAYTVRFSGMPNWQIDTNILRNHLP